MAITRESLHGVQPGEPDLVAQTLAELPGLAPEQVDSQRALARQMREERLGRIQAKASAYEPRKAALLLVASLIVGVFWLLGKAAKVVFRASAFTVAAAQVGWADGTGRGPTKAELAEEARRLRQEVVRLGGSAPDTAPAGWERRASVR